MVSFDFVSAIVFYSLLIILIIAKRKKLEFHKVLFPLLYVFLYKGKTGINFMKKVADKLRLFWHIYGVLAIIFGYAGMIAILVLLVWITRQSILLNTPLVTPVLPGIKIPGAPIRIPFWYGMIALVVGIIIHEYSHGILSKSYGVKIKSSGLGIAALLVPLIPLAFVEPDEKKLSKKSRKVQLSMFAAGPFSNLIIAGLSLLLLFFVLGPFVSANYDFAFDITSINKTGPVALAGLPETFRLEKINSIGINSIEDFDSVTRELEPNKLVSLATDKGEFEVKLGAHPANESRAYFGIDGIDVKPSGHKKNLTGLLSLLALLPIWLIGLFEWMFNLNFALGLFNLLPLGPVDGGRMFYVGLTKYVNENKVKKIMTILGAVILIMLLINFLPFFKPLFG